MMVGYGFLRWFDAEICECKLVNPWVIAKSVQTFAYLHAFISCLMKFATNFYLCTFVDIIKRGDMEMRN
jgi:hypothetical protein